MAYLTKVAPALSMVAKQHSEWANWEPPRDPSQFQAFKDRAKQRLLILANLGMSALKADKSDSDERSEIAVVKHAVETLKPIGEQLTAARHRKTILEDKLRACSTRLERHP